MSPRFTLCRTTHHPVQPALGRLSRLHTGLHTRLPTRLRSAGLIAWLARPGWLLLLAAAPAGAASPAQLQAGYTAQAGSPANAVRGQQFFNTRHGREWRCASCHGATPRTLHRPGQGGKVVSPQLQRRRRPRLQRRREGRRDGLAADAQTLMPGWRNR